MGNILNRRGRRGGVRACQPLIGCAVYGSAPSPIRGSGRWLGTDAGAAATFLASLASILLRAGARDKPADCALLTAGGRGMPGCRISACGPGTQEGAAEPGSSPVPPREPLPSPQPPPPTPTLTPTPTPTQASPLPQAAPASVGSVEGPELQRWRQSPCPTCTTGLPPCPDCTRLQVSLLVSSSLTDEPLLHLSGAIERTHLSSSERHRQIFAVALVNLPCDLGKFTWFS